MVPLFLQDSHDDLNNLRLEHGEATEDSLDNGDGHHLQLGVDVLDELQCGVLQLLKLRSEQVDEQVNGGESRNVDSFQVDDGFLNGHIRVLLRSIEGVVLREELVEVELQFSTTLKLSLGDTALLSGFNGHLSSVNFTLNLVFVILKEF